MTFVVRIDLVQYTGLDSLVWCELISFVFSSTEVRIDLVQYTLGLSGNFNPRLVTPKYLRYIFVSLCSDNSLHLNPRLPIPKLQCARKLPPPAKS